MFPKITFLLFGYEFNILTYSFFLGFGLLIFYYEFNKCSKTISKKIDEINNVRLIITLSFIVGFLGGGLFIYFYYYGEIRLFRTFSVMPGFLFGVIFFILILKYLNMGILKWSNALIPFWCYAHGWGRIGCFFAGCCFGVDTESSLGVRFQSEFFKNAELEHKKFHATQIYEATVLFILGFVLKYRTRLMYRIPIFFVVYGLCRFFIELLRFQFNSNPFNLADLSLSQLFSILFIIIGFLYLLNRKLFKKTLPNVSPRSQPTSEKPRL